MELRKDYILDRYVIVSAGRGKRPFEFKKQEDFDIHSGLLKNNFTLDVSLLGEKV